MEENVLLASAILELAQTGRLTVETSDNLTYVVSIQEHTEQPDLVDVQDDEDDSLPDPDEKENKE